MSAEPKNLPLIVVITGATGVIYGVEMLRVLKERGRETHLIVSEAAGLNLRGGPLDDVISVPPRSKHRQCTLTCAIRAADR